MRRFLIVVLLLAWLPVGSEAKSYGSGGGSRSSSSSRSSSGSSSSRSYSSGSGRTYSSGSSSRPAKSPANPSRTYSSGSSSSPSPSPASPPSRPSSSPRSTEPSSRDSGGLSYDTAAARAQKEAASKRSYSAWKESNAPRQSSPASEGSASTSRTSGSGSYTGSAGRPPLVVTPQQYSTRTIRVEHYYAPYYSRPSVFYRDPYSSLFWWWLLDQSLETRSYWAYHHRYDMDSARYQSLLASDANLQARVQQLEAQQVGVDRTYTPPGMDADLMYTDHHVQQAYASRPTPAGRFLFWFFFIPVVVGFGYLLIWLVFIKRWQPRSA